MWKSIEFNSANLGEWGIFIKLEYLKNILDRYKKEVEVL